MTDPIADMLTRIRNANQNRAKTVSMPSSKMKEEIAKILKNEGFVEEFSIEENDVQNTLTLTLKYGQKKERVINTKEPAKLMCRPERQDSKNYYG